MHDARVSVADGSVHGHEPRHRHRAAIDGEPLLLPVDFGEQASEVRLARGGIEDLRDEHESGGQRHARSCTERARWARDLREAERIPRPREAAEAATDVLAGTAAGARGWARLTQPSLHIPRVEAAMATTIEENRRTPKDVSSRGRPRLVPAALRPVREARRRRSSPPSAPRASRDAAGSARSRRRLWHGQSGGADQRLAYYRASAA